MSNPYNLHTFENSDEKLAFDFMGDANSFTLTLSHTHIDKNESANADNQSVERSDVPRQQDSPLRTAQEVAKGIKEDGNAKEQDDKDSAKEASAMEVASKNPDSPERAKPSDSILVVLSQSPCAITHKQTYVGDDGLINVTTATSLKFPVQDALSLAKWLEQLATTIQIKYGPKQDKAKIGTPYCH
jgi:hypothetical protein